MNQKPYQGWANAQTWCVALTFDNDQKLLKEALACVRENKTYPSIAESSLLELARASNFHIYNCAAWAWDDGETLTDDVNWKEIREHYERKIKEGA